ncbi:DUF1641 domain-containing protein [Oceanidesulfovibrio indonesiensis]|uniref:DUF1641 domain-containing protein n=1 Tax=Oceanidesulfovibrio indonesiensis TaxID=54767 RepID=A0A7M3MHG1_9BACT|nr:DUF1641 domain-containing protein [Oceanidesulfovibrio indonesiensis]TVM18470.1 DUF1641 domain-containing protein [Oceanidesulfovibrio indonesiensis]
MERNDEVLERLSALETQVALLVDRIEPVTRSAKSMEELKNELTPRVEEGVRALIVELADVEADFLLEDMLFLLKKSLRNMRNFTFMMESMSNLIDFAVTAEPLLKTTIHEWIQELGELEKRGVFSLLKKQVGLLERIAAEYGEEDLEAMNESVVAMLGLVKEMGDEKSAAVLKRLAAAPSRVDMDKIEPVGPVGMLKAARDPDVQRGMGVMLELLKAVGSNGAGKQP